MVNSKKKALNWLSLQRMVVLAWVLCLGLTSFAQKPKRTLLRVAGIEVDLSKSAPIAHASIKGEVYYDASTHTLKISNAVFTGDGIYCEGFEHFTIEFEGDNEMNCPKGAFFLLCRTTIKGKGSVVSTTDKEVSDLYHEAALKIQDCDIALECFRGVFNSFLEVENASLSSKRGIFWESGIVFKGCSIVAPQGAAYDTKEWAISLGGRIYDGYVAIKRNVDTHISNTAQSNHKSEIEAIYNIDGQKTLKEGKGLRIIKRKDGTTTKILSK